MCDWPEAVDCVQVDMKNSISINTIVDDEKKDLFSHKNPILAGLSLTGSFKSPGKKRRVVGQPAGSVLLSMAGEDEELGKQEEVRVKFVPKNKKKHQKLLDKYFM